MAWKPTIRSRAVIAVIVVGTGVGATSTAPPVAAVSPDVVISQVYGGGGNTGAPLTHDFVELFNRGSAPASLAGWSIQYASATGTGAFGASATQLTELPAVTLAPGQHLLVQEAVGAGAGVALPAPDVVDPSPILISATAGKVALASTTTALGCNGGSTPCSPAQLASIVDLVGWGNANFFEGAGPAPVTTNTTAVLRASGGCVDTDSNSADFAAGAPLPRNTASPLNPCTSSNAPVAVACGSPLQVVRTVGGTRQVTATDADGTVTTIELASVTPAPAAGSISITDVVPAAEVGGTATATLVVDGAVPAGSYVVEVRAANGDAAPQSATCTVAVSVVDVVPIGTVQGPVSDSADGLLHRSPYAPASGNSAGATPVAVQAVVTQKTLARTSSGGSQNGLFLQNTAATADADPTTSDGIFVFLGSATTINRAGGGTYAPQVGDEVVLSGRVSEFFNLTQLSSGLSVAKVVRGGVDLETEVLAFEADPPDDLADANRYWERREGKRARVPNGSVTVDGRDVFPGTADAEIWLARGDSPIAQQADAFARRAFRDPHPLDDLEPLFDNGNGYRILLGSLGVKAAVADNTTLLPPVRTYETLTNAPVGGVYFSFSKYQIQVTAQPTFAAGVDPTTNNPPQPFDRGSEYSVVTFNLENLYDFRDDPFDGCDFTGNPGCPGVNPPFDYVPASDTAYQARLGEIATQIAVDLHDPDILLVQEAEDQDVCTVAAGALACGAGDDADGKPDTLQELALRIAALGGPAYDAVSDRDGADDRGIVSGFLYRTDRVELLPASASDPVLGASPQVVYRSSALPYNADVQNPKVLNAALPADVDTSTGVDGSNVYTRPPQVGLFRVWRDAIGQGTSIDLYAISNHFSSTPDARVGQRTEQAAYGAAIVHALQAASSEVRVVFGGDLNVYPRPDDPFRPGHPRFPSDQLAPLYDQGLRNLYDTMLAASPVSAYGYVFQGQTQTLDQLFVTPSLLDEQVQTRAAHVNSDFPADFDGDGARGTSDHDPVVARFCRDVTPPAVTLTASPDVLRPPNHKLVRVTVDVDVDDDADDDPALELIEVTSDEPDDGLGDGDTPNDIVVVDDLTFELRAERSGTGDGRTYTITYRATDDCGNSTTASVTVTVPKSQSG